MSFKEKIWLSARECKTIADYLSFLKLNDYFSDDEISEINDLILKLKSCIICIELNEKIYSKISFIVDTDIDAIFFREFCVESMFFDIEQKMLEFEKIISIEEKINTANLFTRM